MKLVQAINRKEYLSAQFANKAIYRRIHEPFDGTTYSMGRGKALIRRVASSRFDIAGYGICQSATQG